MRNSGWLVAAVVLLLGGMAGVVRLFDLRFESGDVYPRMSSLRADPMGARILHDSLREMPGLTVVRNHLPIARWNGAAATVLFLDVPPASIAAARKKQLGEYEALLANGGRVVLTIAGITEKPAETAPHADGILPWQVQFIFAKPGRGHSLLRFHPMNPAWRVLFQDREGVLVMERDLNGGTLVLSAESYPLSNEALATARQPAYVARVIGGGPRIVFDETHLGVAANEGVATLLRRYRLMGTATVLLVLALLFVWQSSAHFLPPRGPSAADAIGADGHGGLVNLLRRAVPAAEVTSRCLAEWERSAPLHRSIPEATLKTLRAAAKGEPLTSYRNIQRILQRK